MRWGELRPIQFIRARPVLAATILSVVSLVLLAVAIVSTTPLRCGPARALGLTGSLQGCATVGSVTALSPRAGGASPYPSLITPVPVPVGTTAPGLYGNPASGPYVNPASGSYQPYTNPNSPGGPYAPFYQPASGSGPPPPSLDCRLPVFAGQSGSGGFIVFPGGSFIADPGSSVSVPAPTPPPNGPGYGFSGLSYDRQFSRWLPAPPTWVSPDGSRYAYTSSDGIYIVNVSSGTQTEMGQGTSWAIVAVQSAGVYASQQGAAGLWLFPFSGTPRQVTTAGYWQAATSAAAYGTATSAVPSGASNAILRLDLKTGTSSEWFARPGTQSSVIGFDGKGNPILSVRYVNVSASETWIVTGPGHGLAIAGITYGSYANGFNATGTPVADSHGVWFSGSLSSYGTNSDGLALYVAGVGLFWMSTVGGQLAGGCS